MWKRYQLGWTRPVLSKPFNVALFPAKEAGKHVLVWDRQKPKAD